MRSLMPVLAAAALAVWPACARAPESPAAVLAGAPVCATAPPAAPAGAPAKAPGLLAGLGAPGFAVERASAEAGRYFAQGVEFFHSFNAPEAVRSLQWAQAADPKCAMCFWAEAWARGPTINYPVDPPTAKLARAAADRAAALAGDLSPKARGLIAAEQARHPLKGGVATVDNRAYAAAIEALHARFPDDDAIAVEAASALLIASGEAWSDLTVKKPPEVIRARALLEQVIARSPDYPPAIHYDIHLMEWTGEPARAVAAADRLGALTPAAGHLVHMPSHLYYRLGRYQDAASANALAVAADRAHVRALKPAGGLPGFALHAHNISFGMAGAMMSGDGPAALAFADAAEQAYGGKGVGGRAWLARARYAEPAAVLGAPKPADPVAESLWRYARGEALARKGDAAGVAAEAAALDRLMKARGGPSGDTGAKIAVLVLQGRAALLAGRAKEGADLFRRAADLRDRLDTYPDPPIWPATPRRSLGAALLLAGDVAGARAELARSLTHDREDPLALFALAEAQKRAGAPEAGRTEAAARKLWRGDAKLTRLELI